MSRIFFFCAVLGIAVTAIPAFCQSAESPAALRQNALSLTQLGKVDEAEAAWRALSKARPSDPEPYAQLAVLEARQQHYKEAIPLYRKAISLNPRVRGLYLDLGLALFKSGDLKAAIPEFQTALRRATPGSAEADRCTILIGMSYYGQAEYPKAAPYLKQAVDRDPKNLPLLLALAHSYLWSKEYKRVLEVYRQILEINPDSAEADMLAGEALDEMKDNAGSTNMFRAAVKADPKEPNVHFGLGYLLWTQKQYPEAAREFQAELENDPNHAQSMLYLADSRIQLNQTDGVEQLLTRAIQLNPSYELAYLDRGILEQDAGRNDEALRDLTMAAKLAPNDVNVHWRLGRLYRTLGKKEEAKAEFDKASTLNKQADEDLFKKIANGNARHAQEKTPPATPTDK